MVEVFQARDHLTSMEGILGRHNAAPRQIKHVYPMTTLVPNEWESVFSIAGSA